jgi:large subunit ribosomal protein L21
MLAVIETGGKQYLVKPGDKIKVEKIKGKEEDKTTFSQVLLLEKNKKLEIGAPYVKGAKVEAKILSQGKGKKTTILKYKPKTRQKTKKGHRQPFTEVEIVKIELK